MLGCSRDVGAAERERGVKRPSLHWIRNWCCSMLVSVKRASSLHSGAKQTIPEEGSGSHCTTGDIPLHISLHIASLWCARLDMVKPGKLFGFSIHLWQFIFYMGVWKMTFGSFLRTHAKNIRAAKAEKANGQAIHQIDKDIEGEAQLNIYQ